MAAPQLLLPKSRLFDRVAHTKKCEVVVPAYAGAAEVSRAALGIKDEFVRQMALEGLVYTGRPMRLEGPFPIVEVRPLPARPAPRRYAAGRPHENREAEYRDREDAVLDVPRVRETDRWRFLLVGEFHAPPIVIEHD